VAGTTATFTVGALGDQPLYYQWQANGTNLTDGGALSGSPSITDLGANNFLVLVVDAGGLAGIGSLTIFVNADSPPAFTGNPFTEPPVKAGQLYSATIATNASDPNFGDALLLTRAGTGL
jgi:hypothetical protein